MFTGEPTSCLRGRVKRHNAQYWSNENRHWINEPYTQHPQKLNVYIVNSLIDPIFIDRNWTVDKCLVLLINQIIPLLQTEWPVTTKYLVSTRCSISSL